MAGRDVDWARLSETGVWILHNVAIPIRDGYTYDEIAQRFGKTRRTIGVYMKTLRNELEDTKQPIEKDKAA